MTLCVIGLNASDDFSKWTILQELQNLKSSKIVKDEEKNVLFLKLGKKNSKVFEQKGDLLNFKANIDPRAVLSRVKPG